MGSLAHTGPAITAAFLASLVEAVEALTIVLAVATVRGWRPAGLGALAGLSFLVLVVVALGPLLDRVPLHLLQLVIGILLLLFGMRWLRKAIQLLDRRLSLSPADLYMLACLGLEGNGRPMTFLIHRTGSLPTHDLAAKCQVAPSTRAP